MRGSSQRSASHWARPITPAETKEPNRVANPPEPVARNIKNSRPNPNPQPAAFNTSQTRPNPPAPDNFRGESAIFSSSRILSIVPFSEVLDTFLTCFYTFLTGERIPRV